MPLQISLLRKCIKQAKEMDTNTVRNELAESEKRRLLSVLTEAVEVFNILRDRLGVEVASGISDEAEAEDRFRQRLVEEGFLAKPKTPSRKPRRDRTPPIEVKGKPLSEIIIEERR